MFGAEITGKGLTVKVNVSGAPEQLVAVTVGIIVYKTFSGPPAGLVTTSVKVPVF